MDEVHQVSAMERQLVLPPTRRVPVGDTEMLAELLRRAEEGEVLHIVPPGVEAGRILIHEGPLREGHEPGL